MGITSRAPRSSGAVIVGGSVGSRLLLIGRGKAARTIFSGPGRFSGVEWSPDGRWLLLAWKSADQWLFPDRDRPGRIMAIANASEQFAAGVLPGRSRSAGPRLVLFAIGTSAAVAAV